MDLDPVSERFALAILLRLMTGTVQLAIGMRQWVDWVLAFVPMISESRVSSSRGRNRSALR